MNRALRLGLRRWFCCCRSTIYLHASKVCVCARACVSAELYVNLSFIVSSSLSLSRFIESQYRYFKYPIEVMPYYQSRSCYSIGILSGLLFYATAFHRDYSVNSVICCGVFNVHLVTGWLQWKLTLNKYKYNKPINFRNQMNGMAVWLFSKYIRNVKFICRICQTTGYCPLATHWNGPKIHFPCQFIRMKKSVVCMGKFEFFFSSQKWLFWVGAKQEMLTFPEKRNNKNAPIYWKRSFQ